MTESGDLYKPLGSGGLFEIRLIEILDTPDGSISCRLHSTDVVDNERKLIRFTALSYVWGDASNKTHILLNGRPWPVTKNLAAALRHVKQHWTLKFPNKDPASFRLWVDALCIDQTNLQERASQVARMSNMYVAADAVFAWLGDEHEMISTAFETVEMLFKALFDARKTDDELASLAWLKKVPALCEETNTNRSSEELYPHSNDGWSKLYHLLHLPYWRRVWIFQEVVLARRVVYLCSSRSLQAELLVAVAHSMVRTRRLVTGRSVEKPDFVSESCWEAVYSNTMPWFPILLIDKTTSEVAPNGVPKMRSGSRLDTPDAIVQALKLSAMGGTFEATDPKDNIYGLLGLTHMRIVPDYREEKSHIDVYCEYVKYCLAIYPRDTVVNLDELFFLMHAGVGDGGGNSGLPSWVPDYPAQSAKKKQLMKLPLDTSASGHVFGPEFDAQRATVMKRSLFVIGVAAQEVQQVHSCITSRDGFLLFCSEYCSRNETDTNGIPSFQAIYRVFSMNSNMGQDLSLPNVLGFLTFFFYPDPFPTPERISDMSFELGRRSDETFDGWLLRVFFGRNLDTQLGDVLLWRISTLMEIEESQHSVIPYLDLQDLNFFETKDGYLGLAPRGVMPNDIVAVLKGYSAPVVIRAEVGGHVVIGDCFVLGLMAGEAKKLVETDKVKVDMFKLK